jgi:hypothetical protein
MASKKNLKIAGITIAKHRIQDFLTERAALDEEVDNMTPEKLEADLIKLDRILMTLPPGVTKRNGVAIDREAAREELHRLLRPFEEVRRTKQIYDDALVAWALARGVWGQA